MLSQCPALPSSMNASIENVMPTPMNQGDKSWKEEIWNRKPQKQSWKDGKWAQHDTHCSQEAGYMTGDPRGKGSRKGKWTNVKGQPSTTSSHSLWKGCNSSAKPVMPTLMNQVGKSWKEEIWTERKAKSETWKECKWAQHEIHCSYEGEYMKSDPRGEGSRKGKRNNGKSHWTTNKGSSHWMSGAHGQPKTQYNQHHQRRPSTRNHRAEHWDDWMEKEWSHEAWRCRWRGAESNKPDK
eukprot:s2252_g7.t1